MMAKQDSNKKADAAKSKGKPKFQERIVRKELPRLQKTYNESITKKMVEEFQYKNVMEIPKITKIVINVGLGEAIANPKMLDSVVDELQLISGRKVVVTKAKQSIANYKLRAGMKIGCMVTLRREQMYEFLDRLINFALPRTRDFKGVSSKGFDGRGNYSLGVREQIIFPEISYDKIEKIRGMNITIVTTAKSDDHARALLRHFGMPFRK